MKRLLVLRAASLAVIVSLIGCSAGSRSLPYMRNDQPVRALVGTGAGKITHVVYIVQENRSFNNLFYGYPGALTASTGKDSSGKTIALAPVSLADQYVIDHSAKAMFAACDGTGKLPGLKASEWTALNPVSIHVTGSTLGRS